MKELSTEEKAKRYDEALHNAKAWYNTFVNTKKDENMKQLIEEIFSELKEEREDEWIRKNLISCISTLRHPLFSERERKEFLTWLEKQGEQIDIANKEYWRGYREGKKEILDKYAELEKQGEKQYVLKSSKDEDVRKFVQYIEKEAKSYEINLPNRGYDIYAFAKDILDWLEKQGNEESIDHDTLIQQRVDALADIVAEQKLTDKVEPKFKIGDWIVFNGITLCVKEVVKGFYRTITRSGIPYSYNWDIDNVARLWTIQDVNDGDVLVCSGKYGQEIGIIKEYVGKYAGCDKCFETYCFFDWEGIFRIGEYMGSKEIHPANKEQRDLLFQKMKEKGFEWDAEKKQLNETIDIKYKV